MTTSELEKQIEEKGILFFKKTRPDINPTSPMEIFKGGWNEAKDHYVPIIRELYEALDKVTIEGIVENWTLGNPNCKQELREIRQRFNLDKRG